MSDKICVIASHDRRRAGLKFKKDQRTLVDRPEDDEEAKRLLDAIISDPVLKVVPLSEDDEVTTEDEVDDDKPQDEADKPKSGAKAKPRGSTRGKGESAQKDSKPDNQDKPAD